MNRIERKLRQLKASGKSMLSPYITAGDPHPNLTVKLMHALVKAGADILELGIPFSDPMAEGPTIQHAMERALAQGTSCEKVIQMVKEFRQKDKDTPLILMGYLNPVEQYGYELFAHDLEKAGADGTILVDLPPEEYETIASIWSNNGLYSIFLCSPTTTSHRMELINKYARGYIYYVSLKGVTGSSALDLSSLKKDYQARKDQTSLPLMVGFGIKTPEMAAEVAQFADGVIVGAALINCIIEAYENNADPIEAGAFLISAMRDAIDNNGIKNDRNN